MEETSGTETHERTQPPIADLGDVVILLLAGTLAGLRDRLGDDGFERASEFVADLTDRCDEFISEVAP